MDKEIAAVTNKVNAVGAGSAALSALRPMSSEFDPDNKLDFAVGFGNYQGSSAIALGAYYRPSPNIMVSLGGTFNGGDNLFNAGLSFKLGRGNSSFSGSKFLMAKEIEKLQKENNSMKDIVANQVIKISSQDEKIASQDERLAKQDEKIAQLEQLINELRNQKG